MDEKFELLKDYEECTKRINEFNSSNYYENGEWALQKYSNWILKNQDYALEAPMKPIPPKNDFEKSWNMLNNLRETLINIAKKNSIDIS